MIIPVKSYDDLTQANKNLVDQCGKDALKHPLVLDGGVLRFKANPAVRAAADLIDLNELWARMRVALDLSQEARLGIRAFYRDMGYSLSGYIEIFGEILDEEERER